MRCIICGWENAPGHTRCEKCNAPLSGSHKDFLADNGRKKRMKGNMELLKP